MEVLREKSDNKKLIFRKLFGTEIYSDIIEELAKRKSEHAKEIAKMTTACQTIIDRTYIPEEYQEKNNVEGLYNNIKSGSLSYLEEFINELEKLKKFMKEEMDKEKNKMDEAFEKRDAAHKEYNQASLILKRYEEYEKMSLNLQEKTEKLPECEQEEKELAEKEKELKSQAEKVGAAYHQTVERVNKALNIFENKKQIEKTYKEHLSKKENAVRDCDTWKQKLTESVTKLENNKKFYEEYKTADAEYASWQLQYQRKKELQSDMTDIKENEKLLAKQKQKYEEITSSYKKARDSYNEYKAKYDNAYMTFLDNQAGILARTLAEGMPCPVCGSSNHPAPKKINEKVKVCTKEELDKMSKQVEELNNTQKDRAEQASIVQNNINNLSDIIKSSLDKLADKYENIVGKAIPDTISDIADYSTLIENMLEDEVNAGKGFKERAEKKEIIEKNISVIEGNIQKLTEAITIKENELKEIEINLEGAKVSLENSENSSDYADEKEAKEELKAITDKNRKISSLYDAAKKEYKTASDNLIKLKTLINDYREKLPEMKAELHEKPDMEKVSEAKQKAEEAYVNIADLYIEIQKKYDENERIYKQLKSGLAASKQTILTYDKLNRLYRYLSGNVSGQRMDIETFVQRQYLSQILNAANRRFQTMSAGQFELRMTDDEKAGDGRNRGLDLMVYSTVTGKEREIRTLSGGESFMAALALSLGMADQIQANKAAVNMDMMFVDEGFGSLDDHSRNQAIKVLKNMAGGSKLIGIISHVSELKQEIDSKLVVRKTEKGSEVSWQN